MAKQANGFGRVMALLMIGALLSACEAGTAPPPAATAAPQASVVAEDAPAPAETAWPAPDKIERDGPDADLMVLVGDMDNFGFGFPEDFDPFTGNSTPVHAFPFQPSAKDASATDRIMVPSGWKVAGGDGYTAETKRPDNLPQALRVGFDHGDVALRSVALQLFVDDFQAPRWGTRFRASINGVELPMLGAMLNALDQTGPIGKVLTLQLLPEQVPLLKDGKLELRIDDPQNDAADGFALDFVRVLVNPKPWRYTGTIRGQATSTENGNPIAGVLVSASNTSQATTDADGRFVLTDVPAGMAVVSGSHPEYQGDTESADLVAGQSVDVHLELAPAARSSDSLAEQLDAQGRVDLYGIYFDTDKASLKAESTTTLEQVLGLLQQRPQLRLTVAGHTDAAASDAHNRELSERRAQAVVAWLVDKGVDAGRLQAEGHGESRPVVGNDSAEGRALNRRVEIRDASG